MRIVDHNWSIVVSGIKNITTWAEFVAWLQSKNVNRHTYIMFMGNAYPSTALDFKLLNFKAVVQVGNEVATVHLSTSTGEMLNDLNDPAIAFEVAVSSIYEVGSSYMIRHIIPVTDIATAPEKTVVACF